MSAIGFPVVRHTLTFDEKDADVNSLGISMVSPATRVCPTVGECPMCHGPLVTTNIPLKGRVVGIESVRVVYVDPAPAIMEGVGCPDCLVVFWRPRTQ